MCVEWPMNRILRRLSSYVLRNGLQKKFCEYVKCLKWRFVISGIFLRFFCVRLLSWGNDIYTMLFYRCYCFMCVPLRLTKASLSGIRTGQSWWKIIFQRIRVKYVYWVVGYGQVSTYKISGDLYAPPDWFPSWNGFLLPKGCLVTRQHCCIITVCIEWPMNGLIIVPVHHMC